MKKLIILIAILGMASWANAAYIELSVNGVTDGPGNVTEVELPICAELVIDVHAPEGLDWLGYLIIEGAFPGAGGEWGDRFSPVLPLCSGYYYENPAYPAHGEGAGADSTVYRYEEDGWGFGYEFSDNQYSGVNPGGEAFQFIYHCCGPESEYVTIELWENITVGPEDTILIHQIPEPATIALLGLGVLGILGRKHVA